MVVFISIKRDFSIEKKKLNFKKKTVFANRELSIPISVPLAFRIENFPYFPGYTLQKKKELQEHYSQQNKNLQTTRETVKAKEYSHCQGKIIPELWCFFHY